MAFNDLSFVFLFFPAVLLIHWAVPAMLKNTVLLIFSLIFFAWGSPTYVLLMILISFVIFNAETMTQAGTDLGNMFGFGGLPAISQSAIYYLRSYGLLFVAGIIGSTPIVKKTGLKVADTKIGMVLEVLILAVLLLVCTGYLVDGSFSPFLYFRF